MWCLETVLHCFEYTFRKVSEKTPQTTRKHTITTTTAKTRCYYMWCPLLCLNGKHADTITLQCVMLTSQRARCAPHHIKENMKHACAMSSPKRRRVSVKTYICIYLCMDMFSCVCVLTDSMDFVADEARVHRVANTINAKAMFKFSWQNKIKWSFGAQVQTRANVKEWVARQQNQQNAFERWDAERSSSVVRAARNAAAHVCAHCRKHAPHTTARIMLLVYVLWCGVLVCSCVCVRRRRNIRITLSCVCTLASMRCRLWWHAGVVDPLAMPGWCIACTCSYIP